MEIRLLLLLLLLPSLTAIIVVVDLVPIQSHLDSSTFSATNIVDGGPGLIHLASSNAIGVTATGPELRTGGHKPAPCYWVGATLPLPVAILPGAVGAKPQIPPL